jgi:hypothetical protein
MDIVCTSFRAYEKNTLQGFATLTYGGLVIKDCACHLKNGEKWIGFPSKQAEINGEKKWINLIEFDAGTDRQAWQRAATEAVDRFVREQRAA